MFEKITIDILMKLDDEELMNRSKSIKLGYNFNPFKNEDNNARLLMNQKVSASRKLSNISGNQRSYNERNCCKII